jgi:hypothetical protein
VRDERDGGVTIVQRFGGALNLKRCARYLA